MKKGENKERKYYFFKSTVQKQKSKFLHPVTRKSQIKKPFLFIKYSKNFYQIHELILLFLLCVKNVFKS